MKRADFWDDKHTGLGTVFSEEMANAMGLKRRKGKTAREQRRASERAAKKDARKKANEG